MPTDVQFETNATKFQKVGILYFWFLQHNKYTNNVLFTFVSMNSLILGGHLFDILKINFSTTLCIKLLFINVSSFLA
jgi:hypothetical protein